VVRALPASDDSAFARAGGVLVWWSDSSASASRSRAGEAADSVEARADVGAAVIANGRALVVPLSRTVSFAESQVAVAWWPDGATAVAEEALGTGCVRTVGFAPPGGDVLLSASARGLLSALVAPCATAASPRSSAPLSADMVAALGDSGPLVAADALPSVAERGMPPLARWLLACAVACLALEQWMRARRASAPGGAA
jgi:hypothetical protein